MPLVYYITVMSLAVESNTEVNSPSKQKRDQNKRHTFLGCHDLASERQFQLYQLSNVSCLSCYSDSRIYHHVNLIFLLFVCIYFTTNKH